MNRYRLGIDIGTTRVKAIVVDAEGKIASFASEELKLYVRGSFVEQDPEEIWNAFIKVVRETTSKKDIKQNLAGLSLSTQGGTLILVGKDGKPLRRAISWMDTRALKESNKLLKEFGADFFYQKTGWVPDKICLPLAQLLWLSKNEKNLFQNIYKCHFVDSYILYKLTKEEFIDHTNGAITMLFNIREKNWDEQLLNLANIKIEQLPLPLPSGKRVGTLSDYSARMLDLPPTISVFSGGHDQYCSAFGASVKEPGEVLLSTGTAWVILAITDKPVFSPKFGFHPGPHIIEGLWGALTSLPYGGASYEWFLKNVLLNKVTYQEADDLVKEARGEKLVFHPFFAKGKNRASFSNIALSHTAGHFLRAIMEGITLEVKRKLQSMEEAGIPIKTIKMVGGCAKSSIWPEIVSEILSLPLSIPENLETASLGAALLVKTEL